MKLWQMIAAGVAGAVAVLGLYMCSTEFTLQDAIGKVVESDYEAVQPISELDNRGKWLPRTWFSFLGFYGDPSQNECYAGDVVVGKSYKNVVHTYDGQVQAKLTRDLGEIVKGDFEGSTAIQLTLSDMEASDLSKVRFLSYSGCAIDSFAEYEQGRVDRVIVKAVGAKLKGKVVAKRKANADGSVVWDEGSTVIDADKVFVRQKARDFLTRVRRIPIGLVAWQVDKDLTQNCSFSIIEPVRESGGEQKITGWAGKASCLGWAGPQKITADFNEWANVGPMGDGVTAGIKAKMDPQNTGALVVDVAIWTVVAR